MYSRKTVTHHWSQDDASSHVQQHTKMAISLLHTPFVFRANRVSTNAGPNANKMICSQSSHPNAVTLLDEQYTVSQLSNELIWKEICPIEREFWHQDHPEEVFRCKFYHGGLDDWARSLQSRIEPFEIYKHVHQTVFAICLQSREYPLSRSREIK
jgi:hypothetical protein